MIADELIEEVRAQADIVQIVGEHVSLRRSGRTFRGPCPLHGGEKPNFSVDPQRGIFKCFVCGEGGDVFSFPMKVQGLDFIEAVRYVAERSGVHIPEEREREGREDPYRALREAVAFANDWFQKQLGDAKGSEVRGYLQRERELDEEAVRRFGLGYAPDEWRGLRDAAAVHEIADEVLIRAGLVRESDRAPEPYDLFRGRLMFPIYDLRDRPIGFGGRRLGTAEDVPKYINSPDTPIFHKGRIIYGLNWSRHPIRREEAALIVEGYMDYVSLVARGVENTVAPLGTALTEEQARVIRRYTGHALLLYDSDPAGLRATFRAADELLRAGVHPRVVTLPRGEDPDSLVRKRGKAGLTEHLEAAVDVMDRKVQILEERGYLETTQGRRQAVDALLPTIRAVTDPALRDIYIDRVASVTRVRRSTLERTLREESRRPGGRRRTGRPGPGRARGGHQSSGPSMSRMGAERKLLMLLLRDASLLEQVADQVDGEDFRVADYREIYGALLGGPRSTGSSESSDWMDGLSESAATAARELLADPEELTDPQGVLRDAVDRIRRRKLERRRDELKTELLLAENAERAEELLSRIYELNRELAESGGRVPSWGFLRRSTEATGDERGR